MVAFFTMLFLFGIATSAFAATSGDTAPDTLGAIKYTAPLTDGDNNDNGLGNANSTGKNVNIDDGTKVNDVIKSINMTVYGVSGTATQRTHGAYQLNTNSCASCHQTHTGAADDLLFKGLNTNGVSGVYYTCTACHDGTLGFYNVFALEDKASTAGTFGGTKSGNASVHLSDGLAASHNIAPGGNFSKTGTANGDWSEKFDCASCHAPHGSYSDRLLHYSPNGMGNVVIANGGKKVAGLTVVDALPAAAPYPAYVALRTDAGIGLATGIPGTGKVIILAKYNSKTASYERDTTPWLFGTNPAAGTFWTQFLYNGAPVKQEYININYGKSYASVVDATYSTATLNADFARSYVTKLQNAQYPMIEIDADPNTPGFQDFGGIKITKVDTRAYDETGVGEPISKYCGACHTDYYSASGQTKSGMYLQGFRHKTDVDLLTCLKCHFAHGTDVTVMADAKDQTYTSLGKTTEAWNYLLDKNASSALKRYTNMAMCWKCHTDALNSKLVNNTDFWTNYDAGNVPNNINFTDTSIPNW
jgi:hypothetical protein